MKEYKVWAFARSAAPNLPALEEQPLALSTSMTPN